MSWNFLLRPSIVLRTCMHCRILSELHMHTHFFLWLLFSHMICMQRRSLHTRYWTTILPPRHCGMQMMWLYFCRSSDLFDIAHCTKIACMFTERLLTWPSFCGGSCTCRVYVQTCVALFGIVYAYDRDMIERDMYVHTTACANPCVVYSYILFSHNFAACN